MLRAEGHEVESVHTLHLQGLANGNFTSLQGRVLIFVLLATLVLRRVCAELQVQRAEDFASDVASKTAGCICTRLSLGFPHNRLGEIRKW